MEENKAGMNKEKMEELKNKRGRRGKIEERKG